MASRPCPRAFAICPKNVKMTPGICKLLFETPSGFAIFSFDMQYLHKDIEDTWHYFVGDYWHYCILALHAFRKFDDKSTAINITTGELGGRLANLLFEYCLTDELIVVGKPEYKSIIEEKLRLPCRCDEMVMEVMWGLQNLMPLLIPQEKSQFKKVDRLPICKGLDMLLSRHGINNVKQELINEHILRLALKVYHADVRENEHSMFLRRRLYKDLKASGFDVKNWDLLKLVTALKSMVDPAGTRLTRAEYNMFSTEEHELMDRDAPKYEDLIDRATISKIYDDIVAVRAYVVKVLLKLRHLLKKAEDVLEKAATNGVDSMQLVDHTCLAVGPLLPNQSSIAEVERHVTSGADGEEYLPDLGGSILPTSQKNNELTSGEGMNLENEAEKTSVGEQMNTIPDVVRNDLEDPAQEISGNVRLIEEVIATNKDTRVDRNDLEDPAQEISGNVPLIEEVIATNKDTRVVGTTQDVAQNANTQAQEIDAEQIINAQVKNRGMPTNNGDEGERAEATDLSRGMHRNNSGGEQAEATDLSMISMDLVEVPSQSSIDEDQQHITAGADGEEYLPDLGDSILPTCQKNYEPSTSEPSTSVEGTNQENEAEKASLWKERTAADILLNDPGLVITGKGDASDVIYTFMRNRLLQLQGRSSMHTNNGEGGKQADEDITGGGEQAVVTDSSKSSERTSTEKIPGEGGKQAGVTDSSKNSERTSTEKMEIVADKGGKQAEATDLSKNSERTSTEKMEIVADKGGKQAEATDLSKSLERTSTENKDIVADEDITRLADLSLSFERTSSDEDLERIDLIGLHAEPSRTGLHAEQSKDKKTSAEVASPVKPVPAKTKEGSVEGTVQNNDFGRKSLLSLLSVESPQSLTWRSESMTLDNMGESHAQDFRGRESKAASWSGPLAQLSRLQFMGAGNPNRPVSSINSPPAPSNPETARSNDSRSTPVYPPPALSNPETVRSSDSFPVYQPRSIYLPPALRSKDRKTSHLPSLASGSRPALAAGSKEKKTNTKDAIRSKYKIISTKDAIPSKYRITSTPSSSSWRKDKKTSADPEAVRPDPDPSLGLNFVKKTFGLIESSFRRH